MTVNLGVDIWSYLPWFLLPSPGGACVLLGRVPPASLLGGTTKDLKRVLLVDLVSR